MLHLHRKFCELLRVRPALFFAQRPANLAQIQTEKIKRNHLRGKSFGRRHADFRARVRENRAVGFAGDHRSLHVTNSQYAAVSLTRFAQRRDRVGCFTRL